VEGQNPSDAWFAVTKEDQSHDSAPRKRTAKTPPRLRSGSPGSWGGKKIFMWKSHHSGVRGNAEPTPVWITEKEPYVQVGEVGGGVKFGRKGLNWAG